MLLKNIHNDYKGLQESVKLEKYDTFYNIEKVDTAKIFNGLDEIIDYLDLPDKCNGYILKKDGKVTPRTRDTIRVFIDWIGRGNKGYDDGFVPIHSQAFKQLNKGYRKILKALKKGTKEGAIINIDETYRFNHKKDNKTKCYRLSEKYFHRRKVTIKLTHPKYDMFSAFQKRNLIDIEKNDVGRMMIKASMSCSLPPLDLIESIAKKYIGTKNSKGNTYVHGKQYCIEHGLDYKNFNKFCGNLKIVDMDKLVFNHKEMLNRGMRVPTVSETHYRVSDSVCLMPKIFRKEIKIEDEYMTEIDVTALHPNILANILKQNVFSEKEKIEEYLEGDVHTKISNYLGVERKEIKVELLSYFNCRNFQASKYKMDEFMKEVLPECHRWIKMMKRNNHKRMSIILQQNETRLMGSIVRALDKANIKCFVIYDAITVKESDAIKAQEIMNDVINDVGLNTDTKLKVLKG